MVYKYDANKSKATFDKMFGSGSHESGLSSARNLGKLKVQAKFAKDDYEKRITAAKEKAKKEQEEYDDNQVIYGDMPAYYSRDLQKKAKEQGRGGHQPTYENKLKEQKAIKKGKEKAKTPNFENMTDYNKQRRGLIPSWDKPKKEEKKKSALGGIFNKLKKSEVGKAAKAAEDFFNPFDKVKAKDAVNNYINSDKSDTFKGVARGANRAVDSASLGIMSNLDKKDIDLGFIGKKGREPYYNSQRKFGDGGGTDMLTSGLGYLVPGVGAYKALNASKVGKSLTDFGSKSIGKRLASEAAKGATIGGAMSGAEVGVREGLNPKDHNWKQNLGYVGLGTAAGAIADPALYGAGRAIGNGLSKFAKGNVPIFSGGPSENILNQLRPNKAPMTNSPSNNLYDNLIVGAKERNVSIEPPSLNRFNETAATQEAPTLRPGRDFEPIESAPNAPAPIRVNEPINQNVSYKSGDPLPDTINHIESKTKRETPSLNNLKNKAYIQTVDNLQMFNQFVKESENKLGRELKPSDNPYTLGLNSRNSDQIIKQILETNMVNKSGDVIGPSLKEVTMKVPKGKLPEFEDYLVNKHAITRMERGEKVFPDELQMNAAKSDAKVKQYEEKYSDFKQLSEEYYDYNNKLGENWLVDFGVLSKEQWNQYRVDNPHYVSNNRVFSDLEKSSTGNGSRRSFSNQSNPIKRAIGSQRKIVSPIESTIEQTDRYIKTAKRNEVMQSVIRNLQEDPEAFKGWAEIVPTKDTPQDIVETLQKDGVEGVLEHFNEGFNQKPDLTKGNIVFGIVDGKKVHVKVNDPQFLDAITNLSPQSQGFVLKTIGQLTRTMKVLTTGINPVFSLTRNIFRDIPTAFTNSKTTDNPAVFAKDLVSSIVSVFKNDELYRSFKSVGGGHSSPVSSDINLLAQSKRAILPREKGLWNGAKHFGGKAIGTLENLNNLVESAPRVAEFKRITKKDPSYDGKIKGLFEANDVTVNFGKHGNVTKEADQIIPYLGAATQGLDKTVRSIRDQPLKFAIKGFAAVTIPSVFLYAINHNDPAYNQLSDYIKDNNHLIPNGDGTFTKIPKPRELGVMFGSSVERALRAWNDQDPEAFSTFADTIKTNFTPPKRTILAPFADLRANKNFMDAPIVPNDLKGLSPEYQYDSKTSEVSKALGKLSNKSPKQIDYILKSYGGILAELGIPATTKDATIGNTLKQKVTSDPVFSNDSAKDFYDLKENLDRASQDYKRKGITTKDLNEPLRIQMNRRSVEMGKVRKQIKAIQENVSLTRKQKQEKSRKLQEVINKLSQVPKQTR